MSKIWLSLLGGSLVALATCSQATPSDRPVDQPAEVTEVVYLDQGWIDEERRDFYHRTQGTQLLKYEWFLALEQSPLAGGDHHELFRDDDYLEEFGFIADEPHELFNPDGLPVGFTRDVDDAGVAWIGLTCAACHTAQITYAGQTIRIDGGPARVDMQEFADGLGAALLALARPTVFNRFANRLGAQGEARSRLSDEVAEKIGKAFLKKVREVFHKYEPVAYGFGRLDALGRGGNTLFGQIVDTNLVVADAPMALPEVWDAPYFDWVQYAGAIAQPAGRNAAEALGVYTPVVLQGPSGELYRSNLRVQDIHWMEQALRNLKSPVWPEEIFGPIDRERARQGEQLYQQICAKCHDFDREDGGVYKVKMFRIDYMGTDPTFLTNFANRKVETGGLGLGTLSAADALTALTTRVNERKYKDLGLSAAAIAEIEGGIQNAFRAEPRVRPRPLNGAWASAPYLHNGSVPNLYQLLGPADARASRFYAGHTEFDPENVGFVTERFTGGFLVDTTGPGNANTGHEFRDGPLGNGVVGRALSDAERRAIIEYIKTLAPLAHE